VSVDADSNRDRKVTELLKSSPGSWVSDSLEMIPDYRAHPETGFASNGETGSRVLAVAVEGRFDSFYKGKESPLAKPADDGQDDAPKQAADKPEKANEAAPRVTSVIERSPESARLVLVASNSFGADAALELASQGINTLYTKPLAFLQNAIDWSLEEPDLLALRGRTQLASTLVPLREGDQRLWELVNYALALAGLAGVWVWRRRVGAADRRRYARVLAEV
jgi:ABC-2 type transport system permease protein